MAAMVEEELAREPFDVLFVDHWLMAQYLPAEFGGIKLLHEHNAEYVIWERQAARSKNPLVKRESARVRTYEGKVASSFDLVFAVSDADRDALVELGVESPIEVLPNIPDPVLLSQPELSFDTSETVALYLGTLSWQPNIDGLNRFLKEIFPLVRERMPETRFLLAGRDAPPALISLARRTSGVEFLGEVDDPESLYLRSRVMIEVTTSGGGTKLKVLNALARGLPVVASPEAAEGLDVIDGVHLSVAGSDVLVAEAVLRLMTDGDLWKRFSEAGRALVREKYVADVAFQPLGDVLERASVR
jgi:glycosyltransferase involved in cell wall biosynthesis